MDTAHTALGWLQQQPLALWALWAAASFALSLGLTLWLVVRMPADSFVAPRRIDPTPAGRLRHLGRNTLGCMVILLGLLLSLPGVPGQGLLTVLIGLVLVDVPGKRALELRLLRRPRLRAALDRLRRRFGRPPLQLPDGEEDSR